MLLAIERSTSAASAALYRDGVRLAFRAEPGRGRGDAYPLVRDLLAEAGAAPGDLDAFAVGVGPGSFSGVRAALALAFGLALPAGAPVRGVLSAAAAARAYRRAHPDAAPVRVVGDARRGHLWCFDEPEDYAALVHTAADLRLVDAATGAPVRGDAPPAAAAGAPALAALAEGRSLLVADAARLASALGGVAYAPAVATADDVAALFLEGFSGPPDPVYVHPAVVGAAAVSAV